MNDDKVLDEVSKWIQHPKDLRPYIKSTITTSPNGNIQAYWYNASDGRHWNVAVHKTVEQQGIWIINGILSGNTMLYKKISRWTMNVTTIFTVVCVNSIFCLILMAPGIIGSQAHAKNMTYQIHCTLLDW